MKPPEEDLEQRKVVWNAMHVLWLDTDVSEFYFETAINECAATSYTIDELEKIYWAEVYPYMRYNLMPWDVAGEWCPTHSDILAEEIMKKHKFGKRTLLKKYRKYAFSYWNEFSSAINLKRKCVSN